MSTWFSVLTVLFIIVSAAMVLIILVQRPQGGGLAGAFGGFPPHLVSRIW